MIAAPLPCHSEDAEEKGVIELKMHIVADDEHELHVMKTTSASVIINSEI